MKKLIFGLIAVVMFGNLTMGQDIKSISEDKEFQLYVKSDFQLFKNINKDFLKTINKDNRVDENEVKQLYKVFNFNNEHDFNVIQKKQNELLLKLSNKYSFDKYSNSVLTDYLIEAVEIVLIPELGDFVQETTSNNCHRKYRNDVAQITAAAVIGHIGCGTLDLAVIPGLICHGAVLTIQAAAMDNANIELEDCLNKK